MRPAKVRVVCDVSILKLIRIFRLRMDHFFCSFKVLSTALVAILA